MDHATVGGQQVPPIPQRVVGPYHLLAQLGATPTGPVYLSRLQHKETLFALKLLPPLGPDEVTRLRQDAALLGRVEHPGVVKPIDIGADRGRPYLVTEHVPGTTLREQLDRRGPMPPRQAARLVADVADALQAIHDAGVVHRHLDPSVIVVDGRDGRPKLGELGVARDPRRPPVPGQPPILPFCLAPEQLRGERAETRSDVYALGAVFYELLSGSPPFEGQSWSELSQEIQAGEPEPPSQLVSGIPRALERACLQALALEPEERPTAGDLAAALRRAAGGEGGGTSPAVVGGLVVASALTVAALGWAAWERSGRGQAEAGLARSRADAEGLRRTLEQTEVAKKAVEQERDQARADVGKKQQELDAGLAQARADAAQARAQGEQLRRAFEQRIDIMGQSAALSGGQLAPALDTLIASLEGVAGATKLRARLLFNRGRDEELLALLQTERARGPLEPELIYLEVQAAVNQDDKPRAETALGELGALEETHPYRAVRRLFSDQLDAEAAASVLQQLVRGAQQAPRDPHLHLLAADLASNMAQQLGQPQLFQQAIQSADAAVQADPTSWNAFLTRSRLVLQLFQLQGGQRREHAYRALADLRTARELCDVPAMWAETAEAYLALNAPEAAVAELAEARRRAQARQDVETQARVGSLLGVARLVQGDEQGAISSWAEAMRAFPQVDATYGFVRWLGRVSPAGQQRVLQSAPADVRPQLEQVLRQLQQPPPRR